MAELKDYKCPKCGGALAFSSAAQKMKCEFCDSEFEMDAMKALDLDLETAKPDNFDWRRTNERTFTEADSNLAIYHCNSCGGEVVGELVSTALSCPYCDNPVVVKGNCEGELMPDLVIPFRHDKRTAKASFYHHLKGKKLLPKVFRTEAHIDEIKGIYVPFWLFSSHAEGRMSARATRVRHWSTGKYAYTETSYYSIYRSGSMSFQDIPADASLKFADNLMDSLEPYRMQEQKEFQTAYLAGYYADKYDVTAEESTERVNARAKKTMQDSLVGTVHGYSSVNIQNSQVSLSDGSCKYAMLPVWILDTNWKGTKYRFAMNGQSGKFVGNLPMDKGLYAKYWFLWFGIISIIAFIVLWLVM